MKCAVLSVNGIITNLIVCDSVEQAQKFGALPAKDDARIGEFYTAPNPEDFPTSPPTFEERLMLLEAKNEALTQSNHFLEECLVEIANVIYA